MRQKSLDEWRALTSTSAPPPRVFVKGDHVRFLFTGEAGVEEFSARWSRLRVPTDGYKANAALLHWVRRMARMPESEHGWREATVIAGAQWHRLATDLIAALTPEHPMHGACYEGLLGDGMVYRDAEGLPRLAPSDQAPPGVVVDRRYSTEESLQLLAGWVNCHLAETHPDDSLFLLMAPAPHRFTQPLLVDRDNRRCVSLTPAALFDKTDRGLNFSATTQGLSALLLEGHVLALLKNPVSSLARLGDLGVQTAFQFLRAPLPKPGAEAVPLKKAKGMDLEAWEKWLDAYTGTRREDGSLDLLIDGDKFFPRFEKAVADATNHINIHIYIFDRDDVAVDIADRLKQRADGTQVKVMFDLLGSTAAAMSPPGTPMPVEFAPPRSITTRLGTDSEVRVRRTLNPWFSADHTKVLLVDGWRAWVGGMNFGREYRYEWHDMMLEVEGPVVNSLENEFRCDWAHAGPFGDLAYAAAVLSGPTSMELSKPGGDWIKVRRLPTRTGWKPFAAAVVGSVAKAQNYIYVENPYLFDKRLLSALVRARQRGVDVRVVLPRVNDFKAGGRSNLVIANYLLESGVRVYFYPTMTHVKALLVDDWACVGSGNFNHLSLRLNQEQNLATSDPAFAARLKKELFEQDFARSYELTQPIIIDWGDFLSDILLETF